MLKPSLQLKLTQQLTMTPQLQQAIRLLQLPIMELQAQIQQALEENVMLEAEEPEAPAEATENAADADEPDAGADPEEFADGEPAVAVGQETMGSLGGSRLTQDQSEVVHVRPRG